MKSYQGETPKKMISNLLAAESRSRTAPLAKRMAARREYAKLLEYTVAHLETALSTFKTLYTEDEHVRMRLLPKLLKSLTQPKDRV